MIWNETLIWSLSKIKTSVCAQTWWAAYISSVAANVFAHCSDALPFLGGGGLVCRRPFAWSLKLGKRITQATCLESSALSLQGHRRGHPWKRQLGSQQPQSHSLPLHPSPHLPICIAVTVGSSSFVISTWQKNLLVPGKLAKPQLSGSSSMLHKTTFFNTVQDCSLRNIMVSMDFSCQEEDPANTFCMYIYCNSEVEHIVKFLYFSTFPSRKYFFR